MDQSRAPAYALAASLVFAVGCGSDRTPSDARKGETTESLPLLGGSHGGHVWATFCVGKSDDARLPVDPRTLILPGVNAGKATYFNAFWSDCHTGTGAGTQNPPKTCDEYNAHYARGKDLMEGGKMWFFGGDYTDAIITLTSDQYNALWIKWGFTTRPSDFDQRVAERWGMPLGATRNPYPLPGEDPNATGGGSGQLPVALTQLRDGAGKYVGKMGINCNWCHSGKVGEPSDGPGLGALYGNGNSLVDIGAFFGDTFPGFPFAANKTRGTGDILLYPAIAALDVDRALHYNASLIAAPSGGSVDFPVWWNVGHRTRRFHDGSFSMDDARPVMGFFMPILTVSHLMDIAGGRAWIEQRDEDVRLWLESLTAPLYPGPIDRRLAEAGAVLFHNKNLWAPELDNPVPKPAGGNGSCSTCHGVYAPRYVQDSVYLDRPELEGIAAYVVAPDVIGTDPARRSSLNDGLKETLSYAWWSYGTNTTPGPGFGVNPPGGYLAPPLYGVWATAPYFHNASVPTVWKVLTPAERPAIWRRVSAPPSPENPAAATGFDTDLSRAYDFAELGWKVDVLECGDALQHPALDCSSPPPETTPAGNVWFSWNFEQPPLTAAQLEDRKIYNTHKYSQGNQGHAFTGVLTDDERKALVEYLKTL